MIAASVCAAACEQRSPSDTSSGGDGSTAAAAERRRVTIDASMDEWPMQSIALADAHYLYLRAVVYRTMNLQGSDRRLCIWIDADNNEQTGVRHRPPLGKTLGVDIEIEYAPRPKERGVTVTLIGADGRRRGVPHADVGLMHAPTYADGEFEIRIRRQLTDNEDFPTAGLMLSGSVAGAMGLLHPGPRTEYLDFFILELPPASEPVASGPPIPARQPDSIRVVAYNVFDARPRDTPDPFARIFRALDADILLIQEWDDGTDKELVDWFTEHVSNQTSWHAVSRPKGVAIVSKQSAERVSIDKNAAIYVAAQVQTPLAQVAAVSLHLDCCGTLDSPEDRRRVDQARVIHRTARNMAGPIKVIGGDFNLVGSRRPLDTLRARLDVDRSDLAIANTLVRGDTAIYTWRNRDDVFPQARLDYIIYGAASAELRHTFVLDTSHLSDDALQQAGLERNDTAFSDHLPLVLDIAPPPREKPVEEAGEVPDEVPAQEPAAD